MKTFRFRTLWLSSLICLLLPLISANRSQGQIAPDKPPVRAVTPAQTALLREHLKLLQSEVAILTSIRSPAAGNAAKGKFAALLKQTKALVARCRQQGMKYRELRDLAEQVMPNELEAVKLNIGFAMFPMFNLGAQLQTKPPGVQEYAEFQSQVRAMIEPEVITPAQSPVAFPFDVKTFAFDPATPSRQLPAELKGDAAAIRLLKFSGDGRLLATANADQGVRVWDARTGQATLLLKPTFSNPQEKFSDLALSPQGDLLALATSHGNLFVWDFGKAAFQYVVRLKIEEGNDLASVVFSPDGKSLAVALSHECCLLNPADGDLQIRPVDYGSTLQRIDLWFSPNSTALVALSRTSDLNGLALWESATGVKSWGIAASAQPAAIAFDEEHKGVVEFDGRAGAILLRNASNGHVRSRRLIKTAGPVERAAFSADLNTLLLLDGAAGLKQYDTATGKLLQTFPVRAATSCAIAPTGELAATGGEDGSLRLWSLTLPAEDGSK